MAINLSDNILAQTTYPADAKYGPYTGATLNDCKNDVYSYLLSSYRYEGLTVGLKVTGSDIVEYWFVGGIADVNLVLKTFSVSGITLNDLTDVSLSGLSNGQLLVYSASTNTWYNATFTGVTSGTSGSSGTNGTSGSSGSSGTNGTSGSSGSSGTNGTSGSSGTNGSSGSSGTSGGGSGATYLSQLLDVNVYSGLTDGQILMYSGGTWYNQSYTAVTFDNYLTGGTYSGETGILYLRLKSGDIVQIPNFMKLSGTPTSEYQILTWNPTGNTWQVSNKLIEPGSFSFNPSTGIMTYETPELGHYEIPIFGSLASSGITSPTAGQILTFDGTYWVNSASTASMGPQGLFGGDSQPYKFHSGITASDPGFGYLKLSGTTKIYLSQNNRSNTNIAAWLGSLSTAGPGYGLSRLRIFHESDSNKYVVYKINSVTDNGSWWTFDVSYVDNNSSFSVNDNIVITYTDAGDGTSGTDGTSGSSGSSGTDGTSGSSGNDGTSGSSGTNGTSGSSGNDGTSGSSGTNGTSGSSGSSGIGITGTDGTSGSSGSSGINGTSGSSGTDGTSGSSGTNGTSGSSGSSGTNGTSGSSGTDGTSGSSGSSGTNGTSGSSGSSGTNGTSGSSGSSGINGTSGSSGTDGTSGSSGVSGTDGTSGSSGSSGINGTSGSSGSSGTDGTSGSSGSSGTNGTSGSSGSSGINGTSGSSGTNGTSGSSGINGTSGSSGSSGINGTSGSSGTNGTSGSSGSSGINGTSGSSGTDGTSGSSGSSGINGTSGSSGTNGTSGSSGSSGINGTSGSSGSSGTNGTSGSSGSSGTDGTSGSSGSSGINGTSGSSGTNGTSGSSGTNGTSGSSGSSGTDGTSGSSGSSGTDGTSGSSGSSGTDGTSGSSGTNGTSGSSGSSGTDGTSGSSGSSGTNGTSGSSGTNGTSGSSGSSGTNGTSGSSGTNGTSGSSGTNGTSGSSGTNGTSGSSGISGTDGTSGSSGSSGTDGTSGSSGTNGTSGSSGTDGLNGFMLSGTTSGQTLVWSGGTWVVAMDVIGTAEDGTYTDGLFTDFDVMTPIGTAIDRFNEVLKALAPPPAPDLTSSSTAIGGTVQATNGKVSFGTDNTISGYFNSGLTVGTTYYLSAGNGAVSGTFANNVSAHAYSYLANAFKNTGTIIVSSIYSATTYSHTVNLDTLTGSSYNQTVSGITITLSAIQYCKFADTTPFVLFVYRTGTWSVASTNLNNGYNFVKVEYQSNPITGTTFAVDKDATLTTISGTTLTGLAMAGSKYLSGVRYHTSGTALYNATINNAYENTYYNAGTISFTTTNCTIVSTTIPNVTGAGAENTTIPITNRTATITATRLLNQAIDAKIATVQRTLSRNSTPTNTTQTISGILMDNITDASTNTLDLFDGEGYRLQNNTYTTWSDITGATNVWDSTHNLTGVTGLQVYGGTLVYPSINFSTITNAYAGNPNYTGLSGAKTYIRKFYLGLGVSNMVLVISGSGTGTFKTAADSTGNYIWVEAQSGVSPGPSLTGWRDCYKDYPADPNGCYGSTYGSSRTFGGNWGLTFGTNGTSYSNGYVIIRITTNAAITATQIQLTAF